MGVLTHLAAGFVFRMIALVQGAADVACKESGADYTDGACVLQVVSNRSRSGWARYAPKGDLSRALWSPAQHAHGCGFAPRAEHYRIALDFVRGALEVPDFCRRALWYCGRYDRPGLCESRGGVRLGQIAHTYWGKAPKKQKGPGFPSPLEAFKP